jgi:hypothetical protein
MIRKIIFVSNNTEYDLLARLLHNSLMPISYILKRILTSHIVNNNRNLAILNVSRDKTFEPFLPSSVPKVQLESLLPNLNVLNRKVNTNSRRLIQIKRVLNVPLDNRTLSYSLVPKENELELFERRKCHVWIHKRGH